MEEVVKVYIAMCQLHNFRIITRVINFVETQILMSVFYHTIIVIIMLLALIPMEAIPAHVIKDFTAVGSSVLVSSII